MSEKTNIQWTDHTFSMWYGCRGVAAECDNCYIPRTPPLRIRGMKHGSERVRVSESTAMQPYRWNRAAENAGVSRRVFTASLSDWLDAENVPIEWLTRLLDIIHDTPSLEWLTLTKRPKLWKTRIRAALEYMRNNQPPHGKNAEGMVSGWLSGIAPSNVWIGVSAGADQRAALDIPAKIHFLSCEPMLHALAATCASEFDWIVFGGESGSQARRCSLSWIRDGVSFCRQHGAAPFVKQMGSNCVDPTGEPLRLKHSHGGDMTEWPEDLRIREFPSL